MGSNHESPAWQEVKGKEETEIQPQSGPQVSANGSTLLKLHKPGIPIRPVINNKNAPSYKIAKNLMTFSKDPYFLTTTILPQTQQALLTIWSNLRSTSNIEY